MTIPKVFHHIWVGEAPLPDGFSNIRDRWLELNPGWEARLWRDDDLRWLRHQGLFDRATLPAQQADIARYELLNRYGGVYLDVDMEALRPLAPLLGGVTFFAGMESVSLVAIGIIGSEPHHPLLEELVDALPLWAMTQGPEGINHQTGPHLLTAVVEEGGWRSSEGVKIFSPDHFYPYEYGERWRRHEEFPHAYAIHHWQNTWRGSLGIKPHFGELWSSAKKLDGRMLVRLSGRGLRTRMRRVRDEALRPRVASQARRVVGRVQNLADTPRAVPWGPGQVLVRGPLDTRLLCSTDDVSLGPELALTGTYDAPFVSFLRSFLEPGMTFVDVGANVGLFTVLAAKLVGPTGRVVSVECNPALLSLLRRNISMNWQAGWVEVAPFAAHRQTGTLTLTVPKTRNILGTIREQAPEDDPEEELDSYPVQAARLDDMLRDHEWIDLMKIDVEGEEPAVLDGASRLLEEGRIGAIALEYRWDALTPAARADLEAWFMEASTSLGARFGEPGSSATLSLEDVLSRALFANLIVRFPTGAGVRR